ncbi:GL26961 [Drosophila persimilis]|uniref:GL26961 n=1 Tax=Drosophila persimilis TaxID=7234 RepID=B4IRD3_DROPE|nr:GL26961 [Drosophila persimilis]
MVHFERDIGDSANVSAKQQKRDRYEEAGDEQHIWITVMVKGVVATMVQAETAKGPCAAPKTSAIRDHRLDGAEARESRIAEQTKPMGSGVAVETKYRRKEN